MFIVFHSKLKKKYFEKDFYSSFILSGIESRSWILPWSEVEWLLYLLFGAAYLYCI